MSPRAQLLGVVGLVAMAVAFGAVLLRPRKTPDAPTPISMAGTYCAAIDAAPPAEPQGPLPEDPVLAVWTQSVESATEDYLAANAYWNLHDRSTPLSDGDIACMRRLRSAIVQKMPPNSRLRRYATHSLDRLLSDSDAGEHDLAIAQNEEEAANAQPSRSALLHRLTEEDLADAESRSMTRYLAEFPDNARLRRAAILHFSPYVEDNFSSVDGDLDREEVFMRATANTWPARLGVDFELMVAGDPQSRDARYFTMRWLRHPFGRATLDLGNTGNALRVARDLGRGHPEVTRALLPAVERVATSESLPAHRRARWAALRSYLLAGAPDPGQPMEPALTKELLQGDSRGMQWALGFIPNELEEHAPNPYPIIRDKALIDALVKCADSPSHAYTDEEQVLLLDATSRTPPGTALAFMVRMTASPNESVWLAAIEAMRRQMAQLETPEARIALLAPHLAGLRAGLGKKVCSHVEALTFLVNANDSEIDAEEASCLQGKPAPDVSYLQDLFGACLRHHELGWQRTSAALHAGAQPGEDGAYARRVASGCGSGTD